MFRQTVPALIFILFSFSTLAQAAQVKVPDWTLTDAQGNPVHFHESAQDRISVLLFWATWCPFCQTLMPHIQSVADDYAGAPVDFYALNILENADPEAYMRKHGFTFRLLPEADPIAKKYGIEGTPGLLIVGPGLELLYERPSDTADEKVEAAMRGRIEQALSDL